MLNVSQFIADHITGRQKSMFAADIEANRDKLRAEIEGKRVLVIGGAGTKTRQDRSPVAITTAPHPGKQSSRAP